MTKYIFIFTPPPPAKSPPNPPRPPSALLPFPMPFTTYT